MNLKEKVRYCLEEDEESRNSDIRLTQKVWQIFHQNKVLALTDGSLVVKIADLFELPREDHISRIRRNIQESAMKEISKGRTIFVRYLPTSEEVARQRKLNEERWREYLGL